jgi:hypothetical protein
MPAGTSQVVPIRKLKQTNRHLWPMYGELTILLFAAGVFLANYKS